MTNAGNELQRALSHHSAKMISAVIGYATCSSVLDGVENIVSGKSGCNKVVDLREGYTDYELGKFWEAMNFEYYSGYGSQELFGVVWFDDGTWLEREEYDGSEWWVRRERPEIPDCLKEGYYGKVGA